MEESVMDMDDGDVPSLADGDHTSDKLTAAINLLIESHNKLRLEIKNSNLLSTKNEQKIHDLSTKIKVISDTISTRNREGNIIIFNIRDDHKHNSNLFDTVKIMFETAGIDIPDIAIDDAFRLGKTQNERPVLIKFISARWVKFCFKNLKAFKKINLNIANDLSIEQRRERAELIREKKALQNQGIETVIKRGRLVKKYSQRREEKEREIALSSLREVNQSISPPPQQVIEVGETSTPAVHNLPPRPFSVARRKRGRPLPPNKASSAIETSKTLYDFFTLQSPDEKKKRVEPLLPSPPISNILPLPPPPPQ